MKLLHHSGNGASFCFSCVRVSAFHLGVLNPQFSLCQFRLLRYWLKGPKAETWEVWLDLAGIPDNVRRNADGDFWVAIHGKRTLVEMYSGALPWLRHFVGKVPIPSKYLYAMLAPKPHAMVLRYNSDGQLLEVLEDQAGKVVMIMSEAEEHNGKLYIGSALVPQIAIYTLPRRA